MARIDWAALLEEESAEDLWTALFQLISRHPAVRPLHFAPDGAAVASHLEINADFTQELFLELLQKRRFDYYVNSNYNSDQIENELVYIELPNLIGARLRKRYPESFRMARRVSSLLKSSKRFRRFSGVTRSSDEDHGNSAAGSTAARGRMVDQFFGLREWADDKPFKDPGVVAELAREIPIRRRDTRVVGRSGSSQLIISTRDLEELIAEIFAVIDSPSDVRSLRQLALAKLPLQDCRTMSLERSFDSDNASESPRRYEAVDTRSTPEAELLQFEQHRHEGRMAEDFLLLLRRKVNNNQRRYARLVRTLWHIYFDPDSPSQLQIAEKLGVSDSLISDNRRLIEYELKSLRLDRDHGMGFSDSLKTLVAPPNWIRIAS